MMANKFKMATGDESSVAPSIILADQVESSLSGFLGKMTSVSHMNFATFKSSTRVSQITAGVITSVMTNLKRG